MKILAFDPGYERLGVAVLEREKGKDVLHYSGCIRTSASLSFPERLNAIGAAVEQLMDEWQPDAAALEEVYFKNNAKTAMQVAEVRGVLTYVAAARGLAVHQYTPTEVKVAVTGHGASDKAAIARMVSKLLPLPRGKRLDDELDAIAVGITCLASIR